jgi:hypothetical protein
MFVTVEEKRTNSLAVSSGTLTPQMVQARVKASCSVSFFKLCVFFTRSRARCLTALGGLGGLSKGKENAMLSRVTATKPDGKMVEPTLLNLISVPSEGTGVLHQRVLSPE